MLLLGRASQPRAIVRWLAAVVLITALAPRANAAETVIGQVARPTTLKTYDGWLVWSAWSPRTQRYSLVAFHAGVTQRLKVRPSRGPFDFDVGPDAHGRLTAVYSRCRKPAPRSGLVPSIPVWTRAEGCDLYRFDFRSQTEQPLRAFNTRAGSEVLPSIWGRHVAFVRVHERRRGIAGLLPHLFIGTLPSGTVVPLRGGSRGHYERRPDRSLFSGGPGPTAIDLRGRRLAYSWSYWSAECSNDLDPVPASELWLASTSGRERRIASSCGIAFEPAALGPTELFFLSDPDAHPDRAFHYGLFDLATRAFSDATSGAGPEHWGPATRDGGTIYFNRAIGTGRSGWDIVATSDVVFQPAPAPELERSSPPPE